MKVMSAYSVRPGFVKEAAARFLSGLAVPEEGVKLLGRWHKTDLSGGFALFETNDLAALYAGALKWAEVLEFHNALVIEDEEAGPALAKVFGK